MKNRINLVLGDYFHVRIILTCLGILANTGCKETAKRYDSYVGTWKESFVADPADGSRIWTFSDNGQFSSRLVQEATTHADGEEDEAGDTIGKYRMEDDTLTLNYGISDAASPHLMSLSLGYHYNAQDDQLGLMVFLRQNRDQNSSGVIGVWTHTLSATTFSLSGKRAKRQEEHITLEFRPDGIFSKINEVQSEEQQRIDGNYRQIGSEGRSYELVYFNPAKRGTQDTFVVRLMDIDHLAVTLLSRQDPTEQEDD